MNKFGDGKLQLNVVLQDDAKNSTVVFEGDDTPVNNDEFKSGPDINVKITLGYGQIYIDFPNVAKEIIYGPNPEDCDQETLSITIDYFNDKIKVLHNGHLVTTGEGFDDSEAIHILESVSKVIEKK